MDTKELVGILSNDTAEPLESEFDIEELLLSINGLDEKIDWLKKLKASRQQSISNRISTLEGRKERLRNVIVATLKSIDKKSLSFPGVGKVVTKKVKGKWIVDNEEKLMAHLRKHLDDDELENIVITKQSISKKDLNKRLDLWEGLDSLPDSVSKTKEQTSLSVSIDKGFSETEKAQSIIQNTSEVLDMDSFDSLDSFDI